MEENNEKKGGETCRRVFFTDSTHDVHEKWTREEKTPPDGA